MSTSRKPSLVSTLTNPLATLAVALLAALVPAVPAVGQKQAQAIYPLLVDLLDKTNTNGPVMLTGNPTPPSAPANGVCVNGIYFYSPGGQDVRTPFLPNLNTNDFQFDVEFTLAALPSATIAPVLMGGHSYRWLGLYVQSNGTVGIKHNNSNLSWSTTTLVVGRWYVASVKYESGTVEVLLDGRLIQSVAVGVLNTGNNLNFTTNDFSNGRSHNGCIRNVAIWNDTTLGNAASVTDYGTTCDGLAMSGNGVPTIGNAAFGLKLTSVPVVSPVVFVGLGQFIVDPGLDLTGFGMAGCYSYTSLDLGIFGPGPVVGGIGIVSLPIPNIVSLAGLVLFTQGISYSAATSLGLAASNATMMIIGF